MKLQDADMLELVNFVAGRRVPGTGAGTVLRDPLSGEPLARADSTGLDLPGAYAWARQEGGAALRALSYAERAALLARVAEVLQANRDKYYDIALRNAGTVRQDSAIDIEGGIYTLSYYAKLGAKLEGQAFRPDGEPVSLARDDAYAVQHIAVPARGLALLINAFNFPSWGLWEKAAPALLSGVPVVAKPATATAWLAHEMVADVLAAHVLPEGALSLVCGASAGLLDALAPGDVLALRNAADAARLRQALRPGQRVLLIGGGFVGLEVAASATRLGCRVTVVEKQPRLLPRAVSAWAAGRVLALHAGQGVEVKLGCAPVDIVRAGAAFQYVLDDGTRWLAGYCHAAGIRRRWIGNDRSRADDANHRRLGRGFCWCIGRAHEYLWFKSCRRIWHRRAAPTLARTVDRRPRKSLLRSHRARCRSRHYQTFHACGTPW